MELAFGFSILMGSLSAQALIAYIGFLTLPVATRHMPHTGVAKMRSPIGILWQACIVHRRDCGRLGQGQAISVGTLKGVTRSGLRLREVGPACI
ncbi:hypothetical protein WR25_15562 [Diploscapter pachys]|uniref:Uncharacterized protein n=1 Tax=Diploscapter pachys TaxID=2018661 RepID=A0A2A2JW13_9BILA|nr:hypothetical protein WR25_15562 [Diploscapter pachys]